MVELIIVASLCANWALTSSRDGSRILWLLLWFPREKDSARPGRGPGAREGAPGASGGSWAPARGWHCCSQWRPPRKKRSLPRFTYEPNTTPGSARASSRRRRRRRAYGRRTPRRRRPHRRRRAKRPAGPASPRRPARRLGAPTPTPGMTAGAPSAAAAVAAGPVPARPPPSPRGGADRRGFREAARDGRGKCARDAPGLGAPGLVHRARAAKLKKRLSTDVDGRTGARKQNTSRNFQGRQPRARSARHFASLVYTTIAAQPGGTLCSAPHARISWFLPQLKLHLLSRTPCTQLGRTPNRSPEGASSDAVRGGA